MPIEYLTPAMEDLAVEVQAVLAERGRHRAPSIADLLVTASAELSQLTVLHVDKDFDLIAEVTANPSSACGSDCAQEPPRNARALGPSIASATPAEINPASTASASGWRGSCMAGGMNG